MNRIPQPPSSITGPTRDYLAQIAEFINAQPYLSFFSGPNPNSIVTGGCGSVAINLGSVSTLSRLWLNASPPNSGATRLGWVIIQVTTP